MKLIDLFVESAIIPELSATDKAEVLRELAEHLNRLHPDLDTGELVRILRDRERLGSTGLEMGVAIPHGKLKSLKKLVALFGISKEGIDFESIDKKPSHLFFLLIAPENAASSHLKVLAKIVRATKEKSFCDSLLEAKTAKEIHEIIRLEDERLSP